MATGGLGGPGKAGAAGGGVRVQGELGHHQKGAPYGLQVQVHLARLVGKDPQAADLVGQFSAWAGYPLDRCQKDQKAGADFPHGLPVDATEAEDTRLPLRA